MHARPFGEGPHLMCQLSDKEVSGGAVLNHSDLIAGVTCKLDRSSPGFDEAACRRRNWVRSNLNVAILRGGKKYRMSLSPHRRRLCIGRSEGDLLAGTCNRLPWGNGEPFRHFWCLQKVKGAPRARP